MHQLLEGADPGQSFGIARFGIFAATQIGVGHGGELALHLVKHEQAVGEHPAAIRRSALPGLVDRHAGFNPADQFVAPEAKQLPHRGQARHRGTGQGRQALLHQLKGVATQVLLAAIAPLAQALVPPACEGPEGVAHHKAPAADPFAALHRFEQGPMAAGRSHLQPGGEGGFQVSGPAFPQGDEGFASSHLVEEDLLG